MAANGSVSTSPVFIVNFPQILNRHDMETVPQKPWYPVPVLPKYLQVACQTQIAVLALKTMSFCDFRAFGCPNSGSEREETGKFCRVSLRKGTASGVPLIRIYAGFNVGVRTALAMRFNEQETRAVGAV